MMRYPDTLKRHLARYARTRLGVTVPGTFRKQYYAHILPTDVKYLNLLEATRAELQSYLDDHPQVRLHRNFHHLNSSQAFTFNCFFPYFYAGNHAARTLSKALGIDARVKTWEFEAVPEASEGTNVDVSWSTTTGVRVFCEVKLTETEFGTAKNDAPHREKLRKIYAPRLKSFVSTHLLKPSQFFQHYQLLRNISLLASADSSRLVLLFPRENESLVKAVHEFRPLLASSVRSRLHIAYIEDCLDALSRSHMLGPELNVYANSLREKYVI